MHSLKINQRINFKILYLTYYLSSSLIHPISVSSYSLNQPCKCRSIRSSSPHSFSFPSVSLLSNYSVAPYAMLFVVSGISFHIIFVILTVSPINLLVITVLITRLALALCFYPNLTPISSNNLFYLSSCLSLDCLSGTSNSISSPLLIIY